MSTATLASHTRDRGAQGFTCVACGRAGTVARCVVDHCSGRTRGDRRPQRCRQIDLAAHGVGSAVTKVRRIMCSVRRRRCRAGEYPVVRRSFAICAAGGAGAGARIWLGRLSVLDNVLIGGAARTTSADLVCALAGARVRTGATALPAWAWRGGRAARTIHSRWRTAKVAIARALHQDAPVLLADGTDRQSRC